MPSWNASDVSSSKQRSISNSSVGGQSKFHS
jgi:hypothetical protein